MGLSNVCGLFKFTITGITLVACDANFTAMIHIIITVEGGKIVLMTFFNGTNDWFDNFQWWTSSKNCMVYNLTCDVLQFIQVHNC